MAKKTLTLKERMEEIIDLLNKKEIETAEEKILDFLTCFRNSAAAHYAKAKLSVVQGKPQEAKAELDKALEKRSKLFLKENIARCYFDLEEFELAIKLYDGLLSSKKLPRYYLGRAKANLKLLRIKSAIQDLEEALKINPNHIPSQELLKELKK